ncbi:sugar kinase [Citreicella sp. C3M06]|uniref:sugar kinase n=1 Tax=Roseobacteraceae TaxID=2854170 RepID=UPI001C09FEBC|nr:MULTISPECIES: sugar kinase [Roseobacteraceae]MBU2963165.1 sugar kinase [Citreicella sp. C3M06]MDO6586514.1 sugar kinase [Salipiger sp. 1_MG-2023]
MSAFLALGECMVELSSAGDGLYRRGFAGDTLNTAWYMRRLLPQDWTVGYATCVGTDAISDAMVSFLDGEGIDTGAIRRVPERTVGLYMITVEEGERSFSYWRGQSAARMLAEDLKWLDGALKGREMIHFSAITLAILPPKSREVFCGALAKARKRGAIVAFDTNLRPKLWESPEAMRAGLTMGARTADIVLPSFDEEEVLWGDTDPAQTLRRYRDHGADLVAIKQGGGDLVLWQAQAGESRVQAQKVESIVDTTAAGDSFAAGLLAGLACGKTLADSAGQAMQLASRVIQAPGALVPEAVSGL